MIIGVPKEIKNNEYRVGLTPDSVATLVAQGHHVLVESHAGLGVGFSNEDYQTEGAEISPTATDIFKRAEMIVKVKEPQSAERGMLQPGQILFTYLHLAPDLQQTQDLMNSQAICIAYETIENPQGRLPLLAPMSEVAGRMSIQVGAHFLETTVGGRGILLGGVTGVPPGKVLILGAGTVGRNAAQMAIGLGAEVIVLNPFIQDLERLKAEFGESIQVFESTTENIEHHLFEADLVIGAVLVPGANAPKLVTKAHLKQMKIGAVLVDVAIDQGGCFETSRPTTHEDPVYTIDGIIHYCVANIPGAVPRTATLALNNATLPYILNLANKGYQAALLEDSGFLKGLNVMQGHITYPPVAEAHDLNYVNPLSLFK